MYQVKSFKYTNNFSLFMLRSGHSGNLVSDAEVSEPFFYSYH